MFPIFLFLFMMRFVFALSLPLLFALQHSGLHFSGTHLRAFVVGSLLRYIQNRFIYLFALSLSLSIKKRDHKRDPFFWSARKSLLSLLGLCVYCQVT